MRPQAPRPSVCDTCRSAPWCQNLKTALAIALRNRPRIQDPAFLALLDEVQRRLGDAGWRYPDAPSPCAYAGADRELRELVDRLIDRWTAHCVAAGAAEHRSAYHDECRQE
jgi:hypothetical protein